MLKKIIFLTVVLAMLGAGQVTAFAQFSRNACIEEIQVWFGDWGQVVNEYGALTRDINDRFLSGNVAGINEYFSRVQELQYRWYTEAEPAMPACEEGWEFRVHFERGMVLMKAITVCSVAPQSMQRCAQNLVPVLPQTLPEDGIRTMLSLFASYTLDGVSAQESY